MIKSNRTGAIEDFHSTLTKWEVVNKNRVSYQTLNKLWNETFTEEEIYLRKVANYRKSRLGPLNPAYGKISKNKKDFVSDGKGYQIEWRPIWFTGRPGSTHIFKHHLVMCEAMGLTAMPDGFVVHHIDENKLNNDLGNLAMMTKAAHSNIHFRERMLTNKPRSGFDKGRKLK